MKRCFFCFREYDERYSICPYCGQAELTRPQEPIYLYPGTVIADRYVLGEVVGAGGFGIVYKAWDKKLETVVAVKEFFVSRLMTRAEGVNEVIVSKKSQQEYEYRKLRFLAEARTMAKFGTHRSIPNVFEYFEENNTAYIVMELLHGISLKDYLAQVGGIVDTDFAVLIANEVGKALKSLHENKIIHRDVAPDNIFICSGKEIRIKLMDFGAAKLADSTDDVIDIILKPGYSPAEQYDNGKNIGPWTDIYALGATMYMMLTGKKPDEATNRKIRDTLPPPRELNHDVGVNLSNAVMKAMAVEKHMRFANVNAFLHAINGEKKVVTLKKEKRRRRFRRAAGILAAVLVVALISAAMAYVLQQRRYEVTLRQTSISVWICAEEDSEEETAMRAVVNEFGKSFPNVTITLRVYDEEEYARRIEEAAEDGRLPTLFESTGLSADILSQAADVSAVLESEQAAGCLFLKQYHRYYDQANQIPLAFEIPVAYVITGGPVSLDYTDDFFTRLSDFGADTPIALAEDIPGELLANFPSGSFAEASTFFDREANTSPVLLGSSMDMNTVRTLLTGYEKKPVFYDGDDVLCRFTYEWSIGAGSEDQRRAAEMLLSWMLGDAFQNTLMISMCSDGQIPLNRECFAAKTASGMLEPVGEIYRSFTFDREED